MSATYNTRPTYSSKILVRGSEEYERCRRNNPTAGAPDRYPREIHVPRTPDDVVKALRRAAELRTIVGVRSGGHLFSLGALVHDGILISFGPAVRVEELSAKLATVGRFFPHGHAPTVGSAGFLMAGGQGWFVRGWGATCQTWITKIQVVVPDGRVVTASKTENQDIFWAARGSGLAFFGVITKFWGRTIRASTLWERTFSFELRDKYRELMTWFFEKSQEPPIDTNEIPKNSRLHLGLALQCYADTYKEAKALLCAFDDIPSDLQQCLVEMRPVQKREFKDIFQKKRGLIGAAKDERWQIISLLNDPSVPLPQLLDAVKPALCDLQTRRSSAFVCVCDIVPDENESALSIPQQYYISTITGWTDTGLEPGVKQAVRDRYRRALPVSCGTYIADYDVTCDEANGKPLSDAALSRFLEIRKEWDPNDLFPNYKKLIETQDKINKAAFRANL
ncbi:oxidoreductase, FAD-binding protein [Diaporthe sp. PMI_573]|nr:oxidoreductase, FAD-binding protein [Diaporthaceae sp. PMI_573]